MLADLPAHRPADEIDRNAYNAAFHELGFRWYWDLDTYQRLAHSGLDPEQRIRHYLETQHAHLLKAYDAAFLVDVIQAKHSVHHQRAATSNALTSRHFDWSQTVAGELGI